MEKVKERINNMKIEPNLVYTLELQDKAKDYYEPLKEDLKKLYEYQDSQDQQSNRDPYLIDTYTGPTMVMILNRPKQLNVINTWLFVNLNKKFKYYRDNQELKLLIIKGNGNRAYCAGGDIKELREQTLKIGPLFPRYFFTKEYSLDITAATVGKPRVAFWDGIAMGGGLGISIHSEFRIVTERTEWSMPEVSIGLFPDVGATYFLPRLDKDGIGNYIAITGQRLTGLDCLYFGIATHLVRSQDLPLLEQKLINTMIDNDNKQLNRQETLALIDSVISEFVYSPLNAMDTDLIRNWPILQKSFSNSHKSLNEILKSLSQQNLPLTNDLIKLIRTKSPTSLLVAFNQIKYGAKLSLQECFKLEYRLAIRSLSNGEFLEGVRATVVDKDRKPKWNPPTLEQTSDDYINHYFSPLPFELPIGDDNIYMPSK